MYVFKNKKGFTLVELVIVIAVVAILAAVLIPTFGSLIEKANMSSDQVAVRNMNTILSTEEIGIDIDELEIDDIHKFLLENGYDVESYTPMAKGTRFYWIPSLNKIIHLNETTKEILYPLNIDLEENTEMIPLDLSVDQLAAKKMNEILKEILNEVDEISDLATLYAHFANKNYPIEGYSPSDRNSAFYWVKEDEAIVLADKNAKEDIKYPLDKEEIITSSTEWKELGSFLDEDTVINESGKIENEQLPSTIKITKLDTPTDNRITDNGAFYKFEVNFDEYEKYLGSVEGYDNYSGWWADYSITTNTTIEEGIGKIAGSFDGTSWRVEEVNSDVDAGITISLMELLGGKKDIIPYENLGSFTFYCGACTSKEAEFDDPKSITVQLRLYDPATIKESTWRA